MRAAGISKRWASSCSAAASSTSTKVWRQSPRPVVINDVLEKQLWPDGSNSVGKRFTNRGDTVARRKMIVVGVVKDVRHYGLARNMIGGLYNSMTAVDSANGISSLAVVAHTTGSTSSLFASIRTTMRELDPEVPLYSMKTMQTAVNQSVASRRAIALWLAAFSAIALTLAVGGIYAVLSYVVGRRRHEIGIRMALGAQTSQVLGLIVRQGLRLVAIGLVIGVPCELARVSGVVESSGGRHVGRSTHVRRCGARADGDWSDRGMDSSPARIARRSKDRVQRRILRASSALLRAASSRDACLELCRAIVFPSERKGEATCSTRTAVSFAARSTCSFSRR
jgi:hypothetical protein